MKKNAAVASGLKPWDNEQEKQFDEECMELLQVWWTAELQKQRMSCLILDDLFRNNDILKMKVIITWNPVNYTWKYAKC